MNRPASSESGQARDHPLQEDGGFMSRVLAMPVGQDRIVTRIPEEPFQLNTLDVTSLVINRTIGTGIFSGPQEVMKGVKSPGMAILMWAVGCIYSLAGAHVFIEYGLNVPRYVIDGVEQSVPRSGGELHYLQFVFPWPRYREDTVLLSVVMFGISFICFGNMASNCLDCALRIMQAAHPDYDESELSQGSIYGIAVMIATITCLIHAFSRRGGILLNNLLAIVKVCLLVAIVIATWVRAGGPRGIATFRQDFDDWIDEADIPHTDHSGATQALMTVVFAYFGFYQPNYVLGEIKNPRKTLPKSIWWGMSIVSVLYMAVNICYMIVVPPRAQTNSNVAQAFFERVFDGSAATKSSVNALLAISAFGNIVVWTFTAARMKQEIAKKCFIPYASFFANNKDVSLGRFLIWLESGRQSSQPGRRWFGFLNPANHREKTPVGALCLHLVACVILIFTTYNMEPTKAYILLSKVLAYLLAGCFGVLLALGILILHFRGPPATQPVLTPHHHYNPQQEPVRKTWAQMTEGTVNPKVGIVCASIYLIINLYLVIMPWVKPTQSNQSEDPESTAWFVVPTVSWGTLGFSGLWFVGFLVITAYKSRARLQTFVYNIQPEFEWVQKSKPELGLLLVHETIDRRWEATETRQLQNRAMSEMTTIAQTVPEADRSHNTHHHRPSGADLRRTVFAGLVEDHTPDPAQRYP